MNFKEANSILSSVSQWHLGMNNDTRHVIFEKFNENILLCNIKRVLKTELSKHYLSKSIDELNNEF